MTSSMGLIPAIIIGCSIMSAGVYLVGKSRGVITLGAAVGFLFIVYGVVMIVDNMNNGFGSENEFIIEFPLFGQWWWRGRK